MEALCRFWHAFLPIELETVRYLGRPAQAGRPFFCPPPGTRGSAMSTDDPRNAVVLLSGGLDSMVCAALAHEAGFSVLALTIDYGQRHRTEIESAKGIAAVIGAERHIVLPLDLRAFGGSALTADIAVPKDGPSDSIP